MNRRLAATVALSAASALDVIPSKAAFWDLLMYWLNILRLLKDFAQENCFALIVFAVVPNAAQFGAYYFEQKKRKECTFYSSKDEEFVKGIYTRPPLNEIRYDKMAHHRFQPDGDLSDMVRMQKAIDSVYGPRCAVVVLTDNLVAELDASRNGTDPNVQVEVTDGKFDLALSLLTIFGVFKCYQTDFHLIFLFFFS